MGQIDANGLSTYMTPEIRCLRNLQDKGFNDDYLVVDGNLLCVNTGNSYDPEEISVVNFYRFEGVSNPDDMSIIYALETIDGRKGVLIDAYGLYADDRIEDLVMHVSHFEFKKLSGWTKASH